MRLKHPATLYAPTLLLILILLSNLSNDLLRLTETYDDTVFLSSIVVQCVVFLLPCAFYCRMRGIKGAFVPALLPVPLSRTLLMIFGILVYIVGFFLLTCLGYYMGADSFLPTLSVVSVPTFTDNPVLLFLCFACLPAVMDEVIFRCVLLREYTSLGGLVAVFTAGIFTALIYYNGPATLPLLLFIGILSGALTHMTESVLPALGLRIATAAFLLFWESDYFTYLDRCGHTPLFPYLLGILLCIFLFFFFGRAQAAYTDSTKEESPYKALEKLTSATSSPPREQTTLTNKLREAVVTPGFVLLCALAALKILTVL